jgi:hypothetical protein
MFRNPLSALFYPALLALAVSAAVVPARAVEIGNDDFKLTFADGWTPFSPGGSTSGTVTAMNSAFGGDLIIMSGYAHEGDLTSEEVAAAMAAYSANDSLTVLEQGAKTLGGKSFDFIEFMLTDPQDAGEVAMRYRIYFTVQDGFLFQALTAYDSSKGSTIIADLEDALKTLRITASAGIRAVSSSARPGFRAADHDVMGRFARPDSRRTPMFTLPAR